MIKTIVASFNLGCLAWLKNHFFVLVFAHKSCCLFFVCFSTINIGVSRTIYYLSLIHI